MEAWTNSWNLLLNVIINGISEHVNANGYYRDLPRILLPAYQSVRKDLFYPRICDQLWYSSPQKTNKQNKLNDQNKHKQNFTFFMGGRQFNKQRERSSKTIIIWKWYKCDKINYTIIWQPAFSLWKYKL